MKMYTGLFVLVMLLVAASGCTTQQAKPTTPATTLTTAVAATEVPTVISTPPPIKVTTKVPATVADTTASVTTAAATPQPSNTWSTKYLTIHIKDNKYVPDKLTVLPGTGVTWINDDSVVHIVKTTGDSKGKFTSADMVNGASFHYTFGEATGTYEFGDPNYPDMKGAIIVKKGDAIVGD
jgi:plastocyanin